MHSLRGGPIDAAVSGANVVVAFAGPGVVSRPFASTITQAEKHQQAIQEMVLTLPTKERGTQRLAFATCTVQSFYILNGATKLVIRPTRIVATESSATASKPGTATFDLKTRPQP